MCLLYHLCLGSGFYITFDTSWTLQGGVMTAAGVTGLGGSEMKSLGIYYLKVLFLWFYLNYF